MPKGAVCEGKKCTLPKKEQTQDHFRQYHDNAPIKITSCWTGERLIIKRNKDGIFKCVHKECTSRGTPIRRNWRSHHKDCKFLTDDNNGIRVEKTASTASSTIPHEIDVKKRSCTPMSVQPHRIDVQERSFTPIFVRPDQEAGEKPALKFNTFSN
jgi:hypothetical protein